jgi:hypothetical protein
MNVMFFLSEILSPGHTKNDSANPKKVFLETIIEIAIFK